MEEWLKTNWWIIVMIISGAGANLWRLGKMESDIKLLREDVDIHVSPNNGVPHPACPAHTEKFGLVLNELRALNDRMEKLDTKIENRIGILDSRVYEFIKDQNGGKKP